MARSAQVVQVVQVARVARVVGSAGLGPGAASAALGPLVLEAVGAASAAPGLEEAASAVLVRVEGLEVRQVAEAVGSLAAVPRCNPHGTPRTTGAAGASRTPRIAGAEMTTNK